MSLKLTTLPAGASAPLKPGAYLGLGNDVYHGGPGISKTGLWTIDTKTPSHFKAPPKPLTTQAMNTRTFGSALHVAILEPERFETAVFRGPEDRRGNKWTDAEVYCKNQKKILLTASDYEEIQAIRDVVHSNNEINQLVTGGKGVSEMSVYTERLVTISTEDEPAEVKVLCKCRHDRFRLDLDLSIDLKSAEDASEEGFKRAIANYGYHVQDAWYSDITSFAAGTSTAMCFLAVEKDAPWAAALYEIPPSFFVEGQVRAERALHRYAECLYKNEWPGYPKGVKELRFPRWAYKATTPPEDAEADV